jgi:hypothetical protein
MMPRRASCSARGSTPIACAYADVEATAIGFTITARVHVRGAARVARRPWTLAAFGERAHAASCRPAARWSVAGRRRELGAGTAFTAPASPRRIVASTLARRPASWRWIGRCTVGAPRRLGGPKKEIEPRSS